MQINTFEIGPIRPPNEADSLLIRTTRGCPWNRCRFCTLFKGHRFSIRKLDEIKKDILAARQKYNGARFETCFLQDGDSFAMGTKDLIEVLKTLKENFPSLKQISSYGRAQTMGRKSQAEMKEIFDAGLNMLYCGVESGSDKVLDTVRKGVTSDAIIQSLLKARRVGMKLMVFAITGLGGRELSDDHVTKTAHVLNRINPHSIRMMTLAVKGETELGTMIQDGSFTMLPEIEMVEEQRRLIERLEGIQSRYGNYHIVNLLTELVGVLPEDKTKLLSTIDQFLSLDEALKLNFILGKRLGYYRCLSDLENSKSYDYVEKQVENIHNENSATFEAIFHDLRNRLI